MQQMAMVGSPSPYRAGRPSAAAAGGSPSPAAFPQSAQSFPALGAAHPQQALPASASFQPVVQQTMPLPPGQQSFTAHHDINQYPTLHQTQGRSFIEQPMYNYSQMNLLVPSQQSFLNAKDAGGAPTNIALTSPTADSSTSRLLPGGARSAQAAAAMPSAATASSARGAAEESRNGKQPCQEKMDEECLDDEDCGNEKKSPNQEWTYFGINFLPALPIALSMSTVLGGVCMLLVQVPRLSALLHVSEWRMWGPLVILYAVVAGTNAYAAFTNPGELPQEYSLTGNPLVCNDAVDSFNEMLPKRAHKAWTHERPIRRYDHYCKWLSNSVGLLNHREFFTMVAGLVFIGLLGLAVDFGLAASAIGGDGLRASDGIVIAHLAYSAFIVKYTAQIFQFHFFAVARNELGNDYKKDVFRFVRESKKGKNIPVSELSDDELENHPDFKNEATVYDPGMNEFDQGWRTNCWNFWCRARWNPEELGEF